LFFIFAGSVFRSNIITFVNQNLLSMKINRIDYESPVTRLLEISPGAVIAASKSESLGGERQDFEWIDW
jgi:hypothetical protein